MTCDDCVVMQAELYEAKVRLEHLQTMIDKRNEHRAEVELIARNAFALMDEARDALAEARRQMEEVKRRNKETKEMLERVRAHAADGLH